MTRPDDKTRILTMDIIDDSVAEFLGRKTPARKIQMMVSCTRGAMLVLDSLIRSEHPDWPDNQVRPERFLRATVVEEASHPSRYEDLIIGELVGHGEDQDENHLELIEEIVRAHVSGGKLDKTYIEKWAAKFGLTEVWQAVLRRLEKPQP